MPGIYIGKSTRQSLQPYWKPLKPLGGETPNFYFKEGTRSGLTLPDAITGGSNNASLLLPYINKPTGNEYAYIIDNGALDIGATDFTLAAWAKCENSTTTNYPAICGKKVETQNINGEYCIQFQATGAVCAIIRSSVNEFFKASAATTYTSDGLWHFYLLDINQTTKKLRFFIDNVQEGADVDFTGTFAAMNNVYAFYIGASNKSGGNGVGIYNKSSHADTYVFNKLLSPTERTTLFSRGYVSGAKAYWPCNSWIPNDVSGNGYHTTVVNLTSTKIKYGVSGSRYLLDKGYSVYNLAGSANFYVPYLYSGTTIASPNLPTNYEYLRNPNRPGDTLNHNGANSMILFAGAGWDRSDTTIYNATARAGYYDAANPKAWHPSELNLQTIKSFCNTNYEAKQFTRHSATTENLLEIISYATNKSGADLKKIVTYSDYSSYHTLDYIYSATHYCTQRGAKILTFDGRYLRLSLDGGSSTATTLDLNGVTTIIVRSKIYSNGNIMFCSQTKAYYSTDNLATYHESTVLAIDGSPFSPTASGNFTTLAENNIDDAGGVAIPDVFGPYSITAGIQYDNINVWATTDYGVTIKSIYKAGTSLPSLPARHVHSCNWCNIDNSWWIIFGDGDPADDAGWLKITPNSGEPSTWTKELIAHSTLSGRYVSLTMFWKDEYCYWGNDTKGLWRCLYTNITDTTKYEQVFPAVKGMLLYMDADVLMAMYVDDYSSIIYSSTDFGKTWLKTTPTGGPVIPIGGGPNCFQNKNSNGYYCMEIIENGETLTDWKKSTSLLLKINKL